jgi:hypothetical protein
MTMLITLKFDDYVDNIYPMYFEIKDTRYSNVCFIHWHSLETDSNEWLWTKFYDKIENLKFSNCDFSICK